LQIAKNTRTQVEYICVDTILIGCNQNLFDSAKERRLNTDMPKIRLKPNSAEFLDDEDKAQPSVVCDMPGCNEGAEHKAPKDRELNDYYDFCLTHVQEYNKAWDYFSGMSRSEIEDHYIRSQFGDRPTWRYDSFAQFEESLRQKVWRTFEFDDHPKEDPKEDAKRRAHFVDTNTPEYEAMLIMGLEPPLDLKTIKARYKELAKQYHPDLNRGDKAAEDLLKSINMAYTILKLSYEKYEKLRDKDNDQDEHRD